MTSPIADGVMAATHRLVQQAMSGQWHEVPKTLEQRRALLDQLYAAASPQDQPWLSALKQAMAESDAVVAKISASSGPDAALETGAAKAHNAVGSAAGAGDLEARPSSTLEWLRNKT
jgi:recombinational DNA repair ATPase RecF